MKSYIWIFIIISTQLLLAHGYSTSEMQKVSAECRNKTELMKDVSEEQLDFDDYQVKCFSACVMKKIGVLAGGKVIPEKFIQVIIRFIPPLSENTAGKLMECVTLANQQIGDCEVAGVLGKCTMKNFSPLQ